MLAQPRTLAHDVMVTSEILDFHRKEVHASRVKHAAHRQFAVRFVPPGDRARVPIDTYIAALAAVRDGLASTRQSFAQKIADRRHWPVQDVRLALSLEVRPIEKGSLVTPISVGAADGEQVPLSHAGLPAEYWQYTCDALTGASTGKSALRISAGGADAFAKAAEAAKDGKCTIHLSQREVNGQVGKWTVAANLSKMRKGLREYVQAQRTTSQVTTSLVGRVTDMSYDQPSFRVRTRDKHISVRAHAHLRELIQEAWGKDVVVDISACVDSDGNISDALALGIHITPSNPLADFDESYGCGADAWSGSEGQGFIRSMRGGVGS